MSYNDRRNNWIAVMLGIAAIYVSTFPLTAIRGALLLLLLFCAVGLGWTMYRGPDPVRVRFGDMDTFWGPVRKISIERTINRYCIFLQALGLDPPAVSPVIRLANSPRGLEYLSSGRGATTSIAGIGVELLGDPFSIAKCYSATYITTLARG